MDGHGFDRFVRSLAAPGSRRRLLAAWCGATVTAVAAAVGFAKRPTDAQSCAAEDEPCTLMVGCCPSLVCVTLPLNINAGVCVPGELRTVPESDPGDGREPRPTSTPEETKTPKPTKTPSPDRTPKPTKTPESSKRASLTLRLQCQGKEEELKIENTGDVSVTIEKIEALSPPTGTRKPEFKMGLSLAAGATFRFTSGRVKPASDYHLTDKPLYQDDDNANAVEVTTSGGTFRAACPKPRNDGNDNDNRDNEKLHITVVCGFDPNAEVTKIKNNGPREVLIRSVAGESARALLRRIPPGDTQQFFSGPASVSSEKEKTLTAERIYGPDPPRRGTYIEIVVTEAGNRFPAECTIPER